MRIIFLFYISLYIRILKNNFIVLLDFESIADNHCDVCIVISLKYLYFVEDKFFADTAQISVIKFHMRLVPDFKPREHSNFSGNG